MRHLNANLDGLVFFNRKYKILQIFERIGAVSREVLKAFMTLDYHTLYDMGSSSLKEQMEGNAEDNTRVFSYFDKDNSPLIPYGVKLHDDYYGFERYDTLHNEEHGIHWYGIQVINPSNYNPPLERYEQLQDENFVITTDLEMLEDIGLMYYYFGVRKENTDWVVSNITISLESQQLISEKEADMAKERKTVIHQLVPKSKLAETYGDMSDQGF